jgi:RNA polymerase sigma factor (sigma-70 family)
VWILGQFENRPGSVRVSLRRSSSPPELPEARPGQPAAITDAAGPTRDKAQEEANQTKEDRETIFTGALAAYRAGKTESLRTILEVGYEFLQSRRGLWLREGKGLGQVEEEDVILDVIASLPRYIDHFAVVDLISFQRWLAVVMRHRVIDLVRKEVRHKHELLKDVAEAETPSPAESLESQEAVERLLAAVGDLPSDYRSILVLRLSGMSLSEISELLGISVSATARRFHRLIHQLRDQLPTKRGE